MSKKDIYTLQEAAEYFKTSYRTVLRLIKRASLPAFKLGQQWRIKAEDLERFTFQSRRRSIMGAKPLFFRIQVMNRYKTEPKYYHRDKPTYGVFGLREEWLKKEARAGSKLRNLAEVYYQKIQLPGGRVIVCIDKDYFDSTLGEAPLEARHWTPYKIPYAEMEQIIDTIKKSK